MNGSFLDVLEAGTGDNHSNGDGSRQNDSE
jgi:hypothetical protein